MIALTAFVFAGQASAQGVSPVSFKHVPVAGSTPNVVSGPAGTTFVVELSVTGIPLPPLNSYTATTCF